MVCLAGGLVILGIGYASYLTGPQASSSLLYLIPVIVITRVAGPHAGITAALLSTVIWFTVDLAAADDHRHSVVPYWNALMRLGTYSVAVGLVTAMRSLTDHLEERVRERTAELHDSYRETIYAMTRAAEFRDQNTGFHVQRISHYCRELAESLGLDAAFQDQLHFASPMHDIGKIGIPDHILRKTTPFSPEEWEVMKGHAELGAKILENSSSPYLVMGAEIARNHHERWSGGGYPAGIAGEAIPLSARIVTICDVYDSLRSRRPYKPPFDHPTAVQIILAGDGRTKPDDFDPEALNAFRRLHLRFKEIFQANVE